MFTPNPLAHPTPASPGSTTSSWVSKHGVQALLCNRLVAKHVCNGWICLFVFMLDRNCTGCVQTSVVSTPRRLDKHVLPTGDRMRLARPAGKPLLLEEFGAHRDYIQLPASGRDNCLLKVCPLAAAGTGMRNLAAIDLRRQGCAFASGLSPCRRKRQRVEAAPTQLFCEQRKVLPNMDNQCGSDVQHSVGGECIRAGGIPCLGGAHHLR